MRVQTGLTYGLALILVLAPLSFGSVPSTIASFLTAACLALGALWVIWRSRLGLAPIPWNDPVFAAGAMVCVLGLFQILPLPRPALQRLSPRAVEFRDHYEPVPAGNGLERPAAGIAFRGWRPISLFPWATRQAIGKFLAYLVVLLIALDLSSFPRSRQVLIFALIAGGGFQAIYGLAEYFTGHQYIFVNTKQNYIRDATGTFINHNHFAGYLEMTLPLTIAAAGMAFSKLRAGGRRLADSLEGASGRLMFQGTALLALALCMAIALGCSRSRMGIASCLLSLFLVGLFLARRGKGRVFALSAALVTGLAVGLFLIGDGGPVLERFLHLAGEIRSDIGRLSIWSQAAGIVAAFPLFGIGLGAFPFVFPAFRNSGEGVFLSHAHNDYLEIMTEVGLVGSLVVCATMIPIARRYLLTRPGRPDFDLLGPAAVAGVLAVAFHSLADFNLAIPSNALTFVFLLGFLLGWRKKSVPVSVGKRGADTGWLPRAILPAGLLGAVAVLAIAPGLADGDNSPRLFREARERAKAPLADLQVLLRTAENGDPVSREAGEYVERRFGEAIHLQERGLRHLPTSAQGHLVLAYLQFFQCSAAQVGAGVESGCVDEVMPEIRAAIDLNPVSATLHAEAARFLIPSWPMIHDRAKGEAMEIVKRAVTMNQDDSLLREQAASVIDLPAEKK